ncbi:MAG: glycoside hydrolase family 127 protein [Opitutales bacterium]|nr:glycoside hydrolase family 127 protein [Opitutales bacterium]
MRALHPHLFRAVFAALAAALPGQIAAHVCDHHGCGHAHALVDTGMSPHAVMYMPGLRDTRWTDGFWAERFDVCRHSMVPYMWEIFQSEEESHAWANFLLAAGYDDKVTGDSHQGPVFNDGDFLKWFEGVIQIYALTDDPELDELMDRIIHVVGKAQREDGYLHTMTIIPQRRGSDERVEFQRREDFETYNMGHLMTAAALHHRVTGKDSMLKLAIKAADYIYDLYKNDPLTLANNAICPSHYMGIVEIYRITRDPRYLEAAEQMIELRADVREKRDHNQDRVPFREMNEAVGHAVRANYLYAGVADVFAEAGDGTLFETLRKLHENVAQRKLYITGMTGALYDGASPDGSTDHRGIQLVHQAYGRDWQLPLLTAYNETCATIGYAMWMWRMLTLTGDPEYADLFEQAMYNGVLPGISLDGTHYFYVNPMRKHHEFDWPMRWSRTREPNIPYSFCCPPNVVRVISQVQNYAYTLSPDTLWVQLYGASTLETKWKEGGRISLRQETDYPWDGAVKLKIDEAPERPITIKLRIPSWATAGSGRIMVNGVPQGPALRPGTYAEVTREWKEGDVVSFTIPFEPTLWESNPLVEESFNQVVVRNGPLVYCIESNDLPADVRIEDVALSITESPGNFKAERETIENAALVTLTVPGLHIRRPDWRSDELYRPVQTTTPRTIDVKLVPYYAWGNRGDTDMAVWIPAR